MRFSYDNDDNYCYFVILLRDIRDGTVARNAGRFAASFRATTTNGNASLPPPGRRAMHVNVIVVVVVFTFCYFRADSRRAASDGAGARARHPWAAAAAAPVGVRYSHDVGAR